MDPIQSEQFNKTLWETNPNLKILLLILIGVFLFSGIGLVIYAQWSASYRQKVYEDTKAGLPQHKTSQSADQQVSNQQANIEGWKTYKNDKYGFEFQYPANWEYPWQPSSGPDFYLGCPKASFSNADECPLRISLGPAMARSYNNTYLKSLQMSKIQYKVTQVNSNEVVIFRHNDYVGDSKDATIGSFINGNDIIGVSFIDRESHYQKNGIFDQILSTFKFTK